MYIGIYVQQYTQAVHANDVAISILREIIEISTVERESLRKRFLSRLYCCYCYRPSVLFSWPKRTGVQGFFLGVCVCIGVWSFLPIS
ncbi:Uncharacterized protein BM_BM9034 [Brugia malayi]|uniref:Bm9034 n=1 Tax=Brugia malayi TaxID=6279 RepID=A0A0K0JXV5_BRUMA|nr:Uncharacterized protein BM_BM9034 [Brugia malayi]CDP92489.1 Bm9034 [Brugia malayi]VIO89267.1 Uncharacterized protein BM_BM9034 [Brugia malayi]